jgi:hypothetical protein
MPPDFQASVSRRVNPRHSPVCPPCGSQETGQADHRFTLTIGLAEPVAYKNPRPIRTAAMPDWDDPGIERAMRELELRHGALDENNPKHMAI